MATVQANSCDWKIENFRFKDGSILPEVRLHYVTIGQPHRDSNGAIDNAILLLHWTGASGAAMLSETFQENLYGPGKPLDAERYFLIVLDNIGHGKSSKPSDGLRAAFPHYGYSDLVMSQHDLITSGLGIKRLFAIVGLSMGGMNAWEWAERYPESVNAVMPVVSLPAKISGRNLLWRRLAIDWIRTDPAWNDGKYIQNPPSFTHAWELAMLMIEGTPHLQAALPDVMTTEKQVASVSALADKLDANDTMYSLDASHDYSPEAGLSKIALPVFALNFDDDEFNPDTLQILENSLAGSKNMRYVVQKGTADSHGHLTMAHPELWAGHVAEFMRVADSNSRVSRQ